MCPSPPTRGFASSSTAAPIGWLVGQAYEINNQKAHSVANKGVDDRITFIFDYVPPDELRRVGQAAA